MRTSASTPHPPASRGGRAGRRRLDRLHGGRGRHQGRGAAHADRRGPGGVRLPRQQRRNDLADRHRPAGRERAGQGLPLPHARGRDAVLDAGRPARLRCVGRRGRCRLAQPVPAGRRPSKGRPSGSPGPASPCPTAAPAPTSRATGSATCCVSSSGAYYLLGDEKPERLSDFAGMVYERRRRRRRGAPGDLSASFGDPKSPAEWPNDVPQPVATARCARCSTLRSVPTPPRPCHEPHRRGRPLRRDVRPGRHAVDVEPSAGAYVLSGSGEAADGGTRYVIDPKGEKYELVGPRSPSSSATAPSHRRWCRARGWSSSRPGVAAVDQQRMPRLRGRPTRGRPPGRRGRTPGHDPRALSPGTTLAAGCSRPRSCPVGRPGRRRPRRPLPETEVPGSERLADTDAEENAAFDRMHVEQVQELAPGRGVKVAVIDSGVLGREGPERAPVWPRPCGLDRHPLSGHGTIVAGLIAGPEGVAPDAPVFEVKVFDAEGADTAEGERAGDVAGIVAGIDAVVRAQPASGSTSSTSRSRSACPTPPLEAAVARLVELDVVVVAAAGNARRRPPTPASLRAPPATTRTSSRRLPGGARGQRDPALRRRPRHLRRTELWTPTSPPPRSGRSRLNATVRGVWWTRSRRRGRAPRSAG